MSRLALCPSFSLLRFLRRPPVRFRLCFLRGAVERRMSEEGWTKVVRNKNKPKANRDPNIGTDNNGQLIAETLAVLLKSRSHTPREAEPEWKCTPCGIAPVAPIG